MVNRMILQGRLCSDPERRATQSGTTVCSFRVAWSEKIKDRETKLFLPCVTWQGTADLQPLYKRQGDHRRGQAIQQGIRGQDRQQAHCGGADRRQGTFLWKQDRCTAARAELHGDY